MKIGNVGRSQRYVTSCAFPCFHMADPPQITEAGIARTSVPNVSHLRVSFGTLQYKNQRN